MRSKLAILALWWVVGASNSPVGAAERSSDPRTVVAIEIRSDAVPNREESGSARDLFALIPIEPGDGLDPMAVRRAIRNLQASGWAGEVRAHAIARDGDPRSVELVLTLIPWTRVAALEVQGELGLRRSELEAALVQQRAAPLSESRVLRGVYQLQDLYEEHGYGSATVRVDVSVDPMTREASIAYQVAAGQRTTIGKVAFEGGLGPFSPKELEERLRFGPGSGFRQSLLRRDLERLEQVFVGSGYRQAQIELVAGAPSGHSADTAAEVELGEVDLTYRVEAGPRFELSVLGLDREVLDRRGLLADLESQPYDEALMLATVRQIRRDFQERGHYRVQVDWGLDDSDPDLTRLHLVIQPGGLFTLDRTEFTGNAWASTDRLMTRVESTPRGAFSLTGGRLVDQLLEEDLANLRAFYALEGFSQVRVGPAVVAAAGGNEGSLGVTIPIVEGLQQRVVRVEINGLAPLAREIADLELALRPGGPFHPRLLEESREELRARLEARGYLSAQVAPGLDWNLEQTLVDVAFEVLPGPQATLDRVVIRGNQRTDRRILDRTLGLVPGDALSRRRLLEAQRRLYRLGIFSSVEVRLAPAPPFAELRDVLVSVREARRQRLTYGVGYDSEDGARGILGYSHANLFDRAVSARFDFRFSQREQQARLLVRQPFLGRWRVPTIYSVFAVEEEQDSFQSRRRGLQVDTHQQGQRSRFGLLYTYKVVELLEADEALEPLQIDRALSDVEISSLTPSLTIDRRDDPLVPTSGWTASVQAEYAFPLFAADTEFVKLFGSYSAYLGLGRWGVLALSGRLGAIEPGAGGGVEDPTLPAGVDSRLIPISERFFAGGRTSHRSYRRDRLGIPEETLIESEENPSDSTTSVRLVPVGGDGLALINLDYRFPIAGPVGGTVFVDAGNVWADWRDIDFSQFKKGAGVGLRYLSPIGPLRLEVGWKLDRLAGEDPAVVFLSFGNPF